MGNAQKSCCFRAAWSKGDDPNDARSVTKLWPIPVKNIDLQQSVFSDYMKDKKCAIIVNVASQ